MKLKTMAFALLLSTTASFANDTTIQSTMELMRTGAEQVQTGFLYNNKELLNIGVETIINANNIFKNVDVSTFINNNKVQVTRNINKNIQSDLDDLKEALAKNDVNSATTLYGKVIGDCVSCHTIIRGW
jgi:cytochrome c556